MSLITKMQKVRNNSAYLAQRLNLQGKNLNHEKVNISESIQDKAVIHAYKY